MKRRSHRVVPDFSRKRTVPVIPQDQQKKLEPPPRPVRVKPPATSVKSGRRGQ